MCIGDSNTGKTNFLFDFCSPKENSFLSHNTETPTKGCEMHVTEIIVPSEVYNKFLDTNKIIQN